jgi:hypothetical protein
MVLSMKYGQIKLMNYFLISNKKFCIVMIWDKKDDSIKLQFLVASVHTITMHDFHNLILRNDRAHRS